MNSVPPKKRKRKRERRGDIAKPTPGPWVFGTLFLKSQIVSFTKPMFSYMSLVQTHKGGSTSAPNLTLVSGAPEIKSCCRAPPRTTKGSSSNTKSNRNSSLPILNQTRAQFQISKGISSNTKSNANSVPNLTNGNSLFIWISRYYSRYPHRWGGPPLLIRVRNAHACCGRTHCAVQPLEGGYCLPAL